MFTLPENFFARSESVVSFVRYSVRFMLSLIHICTKVGVRNSLGDWREILIADGNKGCIQASAIEMID